MSVSQVFEKLRPILDSYIGKKIELEKKIFREGVLPPEIIQECPFKAIKKIEKYNEELLKLKPEFLNWIQENKITWIENNTKAVYFRTRQKKVDNIKGNKILLAVYEDSGLEKEDNFQYDYKIPISRLNKTAQKFLKEFKFKGLTYCGHLDENSFSDSYPLVLSKDRHTYRYIAGFSGDSIENILEARIEKTLRLMCSDCYNRIEKLCCEEAVDKQGLGYSADHGHNFNEMLMKIVLKENNVNIKILHDDSRGRSNVPVFYFPEFNGILTRKNPDLEKVIEKIKPEILIIQEKKESIIKFLKFNTNLIIFNDSEDDQRYFIFDRTKKVESDIEKCCLEIVKNLEKVSEDTRGNEHEKLIGALEKIGRSLGYIPQKEVSSKGNRVDLIWHDRDGNVFCALEVETKGNWKKDIISTWEVEPKLSVILTNAKSEKPIKELMKYVLLRDMPHKLLFLNNTTKLGYLLEKQKILRFYDIAKRKEIASKVFEY